MAVNLSALSTITSTATGLSNLILVKPNSVGYVSQTDNKVFVFDFEGENKVQLDSDITDHYTEKNQPINDQVALKPEIVTTHGFIGELNDVVPDLFQDLKTIADKLVVVSAYVPELTVSALLAYNDAVRIYNTGVNLKESAISAFTDLDNSGFFKKRTKQEQAYWSFYGYWKSKTLFTVRTPWQEFNNMAIKSLIAIQSADTRMITEFEITFKKMYFTESLTVGVDLTKKGANGVPLQQGRAIDQNTALEDNGQVVTAVDSSNTPTDLIEKMLRTG